MKKFILINFLFIVIANLYSQPELRWSKIYNSSGSQDDYFVDMKLDKQGNTYLTGYSVTSADNWDILTLKYSGTGNLDWIKIYDGGLSNYDGDVPIGIEIDSSGFIYVAGSTRDSILSKLEYLLIKYSPNGNLIWKKRYNNSVDTADNYNEAFAFSLGNDGNIYITGCGGGHGISSASPGYVTIKVDSSGNKLWARYYKSPAQATDIPRMVKSDLNNNIYVSGNNSSGQGVLLKYRSNGDSVWTKFLGPNITGNRICFDNQNNVYVGSSKNIAKYDSSGNLLWNKNFPGTYSATDIQMDRGFNIIVIASVAASQRTAYSTIEYNSNGDSVWSRVYQPIENSNNVPSSIAVDKSNNVYITGYSDYHTFTWNRFLTIKYSQNSFFDWSVMYFNGMQFTNHEAKKILLDTSENIYVAGNSQISTGWDISLVKYEQLTGITQTSSQIPEKFILYQNYPNPFNPTTVIGYRLPVTGAVALSVYNSLGEQVVSLVHQRQIAGSYSISFNSNQYNLPSSVYYYTLAFNGEVKETRKMILLK